jgi:putative transposase
MFAPFKIRDSAAAECLNKDRDVPLTFYDFRAELWKHLRNHEPHRKQFTTVRRH